MADRNSESDASERGAEINFLKDKRRKLSPQQKKRLDYENQAHYSGGEKHRKLRKSTARRRLHIFHARAEQLVQEALQDEESAEVLADNLNSLKRKWPGGNYRVHSVRHADATRVPLEEAIERKKESRQFQQGRSKLRRARNHEYGVTSSTPKRKLKRYGPKQKPGQQEPDGA